MLRMTRLSVCLASSLSWYAFSSLAATAPAAGPEVAGMILSASGRPLAGARAELRPVLAGYAQSLLSLEHPEGAAPVAVATADAAGRFALRAPEPGIWRITVRSPGKVALQSPVLALVEPRELPPAVLLEDAGAPLTLTGAGGAPLAGAWIAASATPSGAAPGEAGWRPAPRVGRTGADGSLALERSAEETLELSIFLPGQAEIVRGGFTGGTVPVSMGGSTLRGLRVVTRDGAPVPDTAVRTGPRAWMAGRTDVQGRLRLAVPAAGSTPLLLLTPDGRQAAVTGPAPAAGEAAEASLLVPLPLTLQGKVVDGRTRAPLAGAIVWATADPGAFVRTDAAGRFRLPVPSRRRFEAEVLAAGFLPRRVAVPGPRLAGGEPLTVVLEQAGALRGQVVDPQARPVAGAQILAVAAAARGDRMLDPSDPVAERTVSDAQGRFVLRRLDAGRDYEVRALRSGSFPAAHTTTVGDPQAPARTVTLVLAPARGARGRVVDPEGRPVAGAAVTIRPAQRPGTPRGLPLATEDPAAAPEASTVLTGASGVFTFAACPAEEIELAVRRTGSAPTFLPALRLPAGTGPAELGTFVLRPGVPLTGRVVDSRGRPTAGAEVFVLRDAVDANGVDRALSGRKPAATADAEGRFTVPDLAPGAPVHLTIRAAGFLPARLRGVRPPPAQPLLIRLETANVLAGRVVDGDGEPVAGARINLRWQATLPEDPEIRLGEPVLRATRSEADGRFALSAIPAGTVQIGVSAPGFVACQGLAVDLPRPAEAGELRVVLDRGALVQGRVTTAEGGPVSGVRIALGEAAAGSDDDGLYVLEGAALGHRQVFFVHPSYGRVVKDLDVQPGVNVLDVAFDAGVEVAGRAVDERGRPVSGARIELSSWDRREQRHHEDVTDEDGRFLLQPVTPGDYRLAASAGGFADTELPRPVRVGSEPPPPLDVALSRGATVAGRILGLPPEDLAQVEVKAASDDGAEVPGWTDGRGGYETGPLAPGDWTVSALLWDGRRQAQTRLALRGAGRRIERDLEFARRLTLTVQLFTDDEPLADARVSLRGSEVAAERSGLTGYDGRVRFDDLEPDTYFIGVNQPQKMLVRNGEVEVREDRELVLRLDTASLAGVVSREEGGGPVAGAQVSLHPLEGPDFLVATATRPDGQFGLYRLQPGRYRLEARADGFLPATEEVQLAGGDEVDGLGLRLRAAPGAKLRVLLASGEVPGVVHLLARDPSGATVFAGSRSPDASGLVSLSSLPEGVWPLFAGAEGGGVAATQLLVPSAEPATLTLPPAGRLQVRVPALLAASLQGTVRLLGAGQQPFWTLAPGGNPVSAWPLRGGKAWIDGVPAGIWQVQVDTPDGQHWAAAVVTAGAAEAAVTVE